MDLEQNDPIELSPIEFALLEITNDIEEFKGRGANKSATLTSKDAYIWAALVVSILEADQELDQDRFIQALHHISDQNEEEIKRYYSKANSFRPPFTEVIFESMVEQLSEYLSVELDIQKTADRAQRAYESLLNKGLIEDPTEILLYGIQLAVVGVLPIGFTMLTAEGRIIKMQYRSMLLDINFNRTNKGKALNIDFRLPKFLNAFKGGFIDGFKRMLSDQNTSMQTTKHRKPSAKRRKLKQKTDN